MLRAFQVSCPLPSWYRSKEIGSKQEVLIGNTAMRGSDCADSLRGSEELEHPPSPPAWPNWPVGILLSKETLLFEHQNAHFAH